MSYLEEGCPFCHRAFNDYCLEKLEGMQTITIDVPMDVFVGEYYMAVLELKAVVKHLNAGSKRRVKLRVREDPVEI